MAQKRDWVDYVNLGANVLQTAQLDSMNSKMRQMAELELQKDYRDQHEAALAKCEDLLRETVFIYTEQLRDVEEIAGQNPSAAHVRASHLKRVYAAIPQFNSSGFRKFEDKERLANVQRACDRLIREWAARLNPEQLEQCNQCIEHIFNRAELVKAIAMAQKLKFLNNSKEPLLEKLSAKQAELEKAREMQGQNKLPGWRTTVEKTKSLVFGLIGFAIFAGGSVYITGVGAEHVPDEFWGEWVVALVASFALFVISQLLLKNDPSLLKKAELEKQILTLLGELETMNRENESQETDLAQQKLLLAKFGAKNSEDCRQILQDRDALLTQMLGDFVKGLVGNDQPGNQKFDDAVLALMALGCKQGEAQLSVRNAQEMMGAEATVESLVRACLKNRGHVFT
jgi:hypothetical protein